MVLIKKTQRCKFRDMERRLRRENSRGASRVLRVYYIHGGRCLNKTSLCTASIHCTPHPQCFRNTVMLPIHGGKCPNDTSLCRAHTHSTPNPQCLIHIVMLPMDRRRPAICSDTGMIWHHASLPCFDNSSFYLCSPQLWGKMAALF